MALFTPTRRETSVEVLQQALHAPVLSVDCETSTDPATSIAMGAPGTPSKDHGLSYCAPVTQIALAWERHEGVATAVLEAPFSDVDLSFIQALMQRTNTVVAHNAVFDMRQLSKYSNGNVPESVWCTATIARLLTPEIGRFDLLSLADAYQIEYPSFMREMKGKRASLHLVSEEQVLEYVVADAKLAYQIYAHQQRLVEDAETLILVEWENQAVRAYASMAATGVRLNTGFVQQRIDELTQLRKDMWRRLTEDGLGNPGSPKQRARYIYNTKKIAIPTYEPMSVLFTEAGAKRAASGAPVTLDDLSTSGDALDTISEASPANKQALKLLSDYQQVDRMLATIESLADHSAADGRIHSLITIGTTTGRRASGHPNLQNWKMTAEHDDPSGDMAGLLLGDTDEFTLVEVDFHGAENNSAALISGDDNFARAVASSDFHSEAATAYFGQRWQAADKDERKHLRRIGKTITFASAYGAGAKTIAHRIGVTEEEARAILAEKDRVFWAVADAKQAADQKAKQVGYINLWTGRRVPVDQSATYTAWNFLNQGFVAELTKRALVMITDAYRAKNLKSRVALEIHDSLIISVHHTEWVEALNTASEIMETIVPDDLNNRTTPPIKWEARPNLAENAGKWGKGQYHPEAAPEIELPTLPAQESQEQPEIIFTVPSLNFEWRGRVRLQPEIRFSDWSPAERVEAARFFCSYIEHVQGMLQQVYEVYLPAKIKDGTVGLAEKPTGVNMANYALVPLLWLKVAEQGIDVESILELSKDDLLALHNERQAQVASIQRLSDTLLEYLAKIPSEKHEEGSEVEF